MPNLYDSQHTALNPSWPGRSGHSVTMYTIPPEMMYANSLLFTESAPAAFYHAIENVNPGVAINNSIPQANNCNIPKSNALGIGSPILNLRPIPTGAPTSCGSNQVESDEIRNIQNADSFGIGPITSTPARNCRCSAHQSDFDDGDEAPILPQNGYVFSPNGNSVRIGVIPATPGQNVSSAANRVLATSGRPILLHNFCECVRGNEASIPNCNTSQEGAVGGAPITNMPNSAFQSHNICNTPKRLDRIVQSRGGNGYSLPHIAEIDPRHCSLRHPIPIAPNEFSPRERFVSSNAMPHYQTPPQAAHLTPMTSGRPRARLSARRQLFPEEHYPNMGDRENEACEFSDPELCSPDSDPRYIFYAIKLNMACILRTIKRFLIASQPKTSQRCPVW